MADVDLLYAVLIDINWTVDSGNYSAIQFRRVAQWVEQFMKMQIMFVVSTATFFKGENVSVVQIHPLRLSDACCKHFG